MAYEVVVVGAGIGGLTTAALLAARGMKVCVLEREQGAGGCAANFEHLGYQFEPGAGLYALWQPGEIHERIFSELPVDPPEVKRASPPYIVRLPDGTDVNVGGSVEEFEEELRLSFPECAKEAIAFYRAIGPIAETLNRAAQRFPDLPHISTIQRIKLYAAEARLSSSILAAMDQTAAQHLPKTSYRFRGYIDAQLQIFTQSASDECPYLYAAIALCQPRWGMYSIGGGAARVADILVESIRRSGGDLRFNAPVLRLAYDSAGRAAGVDLLSGERVEAARAVVSNLTVWDTYGKLVGADRVPSEIRARLKELSSWGAYLIYLGIDEEALKRLPAESVLALTDWQMDQSFDPEKSLFMFNAAPAWDRRAPEGKRAVTISTFTEAEQWFTYHTDETAHEEMDQSTLERWWEQIHKAMTELGAKIEVIETATPRTFYEQTRRKLGMVGSIRQSLKTFGTKAITHRTVIPNLFMVGDTVFPGQGIAAVTHSALIVANEIAPPLR